MIKIEIKTNWECYSQYGNEAIELIAINSSKKPIELFEGDCPPLDADTLAYITHNVVMFKSRNHITDYLDKLFPADAYEITIGKKQVKALLDMCIELSKDDFAPAYKFNWNIKANNLTISMLTWALDKFNDEWYDGERHQFIVRKIK
jgi:hypothetical protein